VKANELLSVAESLPIELKIQLIEKLISSLNPPQESVDKLWADEAEKRVSDLKNGIVKAIPGEEVFKEIRERISK
jgi:putative addiction module component (TIGR02574 family)